MRKAKVALARKLAVVLHRMLLDGTSFIADKAAARTARQKGANTDSGREEAQHCLKRRPVAGTMDQARP